MEKQRKELSEELLGSVNGGAGLIVNGIDLEEKARELSAMRQNIIVDNDLSVSMADELMDQIGERMHEDRLSALAKEMLDTIMQVNKTIASNL